MPTVMIIGSYRFFFYSGDGNEPRHIHVERDDCVAKFWLDPVVLQSSGGFARRDINRIHGHVVAHREEFIDAWDEYFGN